MLKQKKIQSNSNSEFDQQEQKQILNLIFPNFQLKNAEDIRNLETNLATYYNQPLHKSHLINYVFRNCFIYSDRVYGKFLRQKYPQEEEPKISKFYKNQYFPDLKKLAEAKQNPSKFKGLHIAPMKQLSLKELDEIFCQNGYIPNLQRFLCFFPEYLIKTREVEKMIFQSNKISQQIIYFLGLCGAAQMGCPYMINRMTQKFFSVGGDKQWIVNKKYPKKISLLLGINRKLAKCIWELDNQDIENLIESGQWNMNQLALIFQILSYVHCQCVISLGLGLIPQQKTQVLPIDKIQELLHEYQQETQEYQEYQSPKKSKKPPLKQVLPVLKSLIEQMKSNSSTNVIPTKTNGNAKKSFRKSSDEEQNNSIEPYMKEIGVQLSDQKLVAQVLGQLSSLVPKYSIIGKRRDKKQSQFACTDFNFQFKACPRLQSLNYVVDSTKKILALFKQSEQMGLQNFGSEMIGSTKQLRKAQRYYAQNLCGYNHPEYDYKKYMTNILTMPLKFYIRILMLSPIHMKRQILDEINHEKGELQLFDMGHTAILIAVTKFKLSLTLSTYFMDY